MRSTIEVDDETCGHFDASDWEHALKKALYFWPSKLQRADRISIILDRGEGDSIEMEGPNMTG